MRLKALSTGFLLVFSLLSFAQQTGSISGTVATGEGEPLPGAVVTAQSEVLPRPRTTVTNATGSYRFNLLPPGSYELTFTFTGLSTVKRQTEVLLDQNTRVDVTMTASTQESLVVTLEVPLIDTTSAELKSAVDNEAFDRIPLGNEYRDLVKLVPGVQVTQDTVRGPSAGGSGQDNLYQFDGVDVTLPLFGVLSSEPSSHDIDQVSIVRGGANAVGFNRSGGFLINSVSKSGTNLYQGELSYKLQSSGWVSDEERPPSALVGDTELSWLTMSYGGPLIKDRLFFYASYYRPEVDSSDRQNAYGELPDGKSTRDEFFAKFTYSPLENFTLHASYRDSSREAEKSTVFSTSSPTVTSGDESDQTISILEGSWIINGNSSLGFKFTDYELDGFGRPDNILNVTPTNQLGTVIDVANIADLGYVSLANLRDGNPLFNQYMQPLLERYGYRDANGNVMAGTVGSYWSINDQDFNRSAFQVSYDTYFVTGRAEHDFHVGYRHTKDAEDLIRSRNGWGIISFLNADFLDDSIPLAEKEFIEAEFLRSEGLANLHSEYVSDNIEINDNITIDSWNINLGVLISQDELYGQDLAEDDSAVSGYRLSRGSKYKMYTIDWEDMIQPRIGIVKALNDTDTLQAHVSWYNPPATSLPRAASWARNLNLLRTRAYFNVFGEMVRVTDVSSSSGKFFVPNMTPRRVEEYMIGYHKQLSNDWTLKFNARHRYGHHFWEDTNNNARAAFGATSQNGDGAEISSQPDYIPNLSDYTAEVGGSSYVIAELDGAFTKYYEATIDLEKATDAYYFKGTYTWSHYYGTFDQDNTTDNNDQAIFIGSSNFADGVGRQVWDFKYGDLQGDRRHMVKVYGARRLPWNASIGTFAFFQSGQPWETWDVDYYRDFTSSSSSTIRFSEPAGSRRSESHWQIDLNYTQEIHFANPRYRLMLDLDLFNLFDKQTGYSIDPFASSSTYGDPRRYWSPRRFQFAARFMF